MIVCIDSGNTRIKWGVHDGQQWLAQGALGHAEIDALAELPQRFPLPAHVMLANVAGAQVAEKIRHSLSPWLPMFIEAKAEARQAGVSNLYQNPSQLGVDRWCALVAAWSRVRAACVVVMAGTATTIDTLDGEGRFLGGLILPGFDLMLRSLARDTAGLPFADGHYVPYPRCTDDALASGAIEAQVGAIERMFARLGDGPKTCLLSGGNAERLGRALVIPHVLAENLPLEGLQVLAGCID